MALLSKGTRGIAALCTVSLFCLARPAHAKFPAGYVPRERSWFSYGIRYTHPQKGALSLTLARAKDTDTFYTAGWFAQAEPGLGGGKLSLGYGAIDPSGTPWKPFSFGLGLKASVLRTWGEPRGTLPGQTLVGPEADLTIAYVKLSAGYLWRAGGTRGSRGVFTWGVGAGF
jgi:hypothetical protein